MSSTYSFIPSSTYFSFFRITVDKHLSLPPFNLFLYFLLYFWSTIDKNSRVMSNLYLSLLTVINWFTVHSLLYDYSLQSLLIRFFSISASPFRVFPSLIFFNIFLLETFPSVFLSNVSSSPSAAITIKDIDWVSRYIDPLILRYLAQDHRMRIENMTYRDSLTASIF